MFDRLIGPVLRNLDVRTQRRLQRWRLLVRRTWYSADHVGKRAMGWKRTSINGPIFEKRFDLAPIANDPLHRELHARDVFRDQPWATPIVSHTGRVLRMPLFPDDARVDRVAASLGELERREIARQAIEALFAMFMRGYAHRDFHARNLFWLRNSLNVVDFESLHAYATGERPPFRSSYDLTGNGLATPYGAAAEYYDRPGSAVSLAAALGVPKEAALAMLEARLKRDLACATQTFRTGNRRHTSASGRVYCSFDLPFLSVAPSEAQRNSSCRLDQLGVRRAHICGRTVLDLGSNVGAMLFEIQRWSPRACCGIECDADKVRIASEVSAYNGLNTVSFQSGDIDSLEANSLGAPFDVVFCLAVVEHVRHRERLFRLLGDVTAHDLFFEGNSGTDVASIEENLRNAGFRRVAFVGRSDDEVPPKNNCRPLWHASK